MDRDQQLRSNDPCPCGSGKTFEGCCREFFEAYASFRGHLGAIRPMLHVNVQGDKLVAVGGRIYASPSWKTVPDFLLDYIKHQFGRAW